MELKKIRYKINRQVEIITDLIENDKQLAKVIDMYLVDVSSHTLSALWSMIL